MAKMRHIALDYPLSAGACAVGIATPETLAGGPPSTDLNLVLPEAKSAIAFAVPLDRRVIEPFLKKEDRLSHERDNFRINYVATGIALALADFLRQKGHKSVPVSANNVYLSEPLKRLEMIPEISLRYLSVASGVGHFGLSGNVITKSAGAEVILGAVVTSADLEPSAPLPKEDNYCDECRLCITSCASGFMDTKDKDTVNIGGKVYTYSKRRSQLRCQFVCGGFSGLHESGKWSSWSPGRWSLPENDENILPALMPGFIAFNNWPDIEGGQYHIMMKKKLLLTCGNCQLVCHPDKDVRIKRHKMLTSSGVVIQREDGRLEAVSPKEAQQWVEAMNPEVRALYEPQSEGS
jgi:epoxyqueuosine reductase